MFTTTDIIEFQEQTEIDFISSWHLIDCMAIHYGFWINGVKSLRNALLKENEILAEISNISDKDIVLDAGCGVGGSAIYLAKNYGCKVVGITISEKQCNTANSAAFNHGVSDLVSFFIKDYHKTDFLNDSFNVIWFVESFCYAYNRNQLIKEVFRLLKPGGRLVIVDGFLNKTKFTNKEKEIMKNMLCNWAINELCENKMTIDIIKDAGFNNIQSTNYTDIIYKSSKLMHNYARIAIFNRKLKCLFGKGNFNEISMKNCIGAIYQYKALKKKLWIYAVITAEK